MPLLDQIREMKLIELAKTRFDPNLTPAELKVLHDSASSEDPPEPDEKAPRPEIRATFLRWLATDPEAAQHIDPKGLRVYAATIPCKLDLKECHVNPTLDFRDCEFQEQMNLQFAEIRGIYILDSLLTMGIWADGVILHGPLLFRRIHSAGENRLFGARIEGDLDCSSAKLTATGNALSFDGAKIGGNVFLNQGFESSGTIRLLGAEIAGQLVCQDAKLKAKGNALYADGAKIGGSVVLIDGFESEGTIRLLGAEIAGQLACKDAKLKAKGNALYADGAKIVDSVSLRKGFESDGKIRLIGTEIGGNLSINGAKVARVSCLNAVVKGDLIWQCIEKSEKTELSLVGTKVKNLREDKMSWPDEGNLKLDGLIYEELTLHGYSSDEDIASGMYAPKLPLDAKERIAWIMLQPPNRCTQPQPWMQLRELLERKGDRKGAKYVLFRFRCLQAQKSWILWRWLRIAFAWLEENPLRIGYSILFTLALGTLVFAGAVRSGAMIETIKTQPNMIATYEESLKGAARNPDQSNKPISLHYTSFQPFIYTLENAVPLVKLGMDERWMPDLQHQPQPWCHIGWLGWLKWFNSYGFLVWSRWLLILSGWFQATVLAAALADRFRK